MAATRSRAGAVRAAAAPRRRPARPAGPALPGPLRAAHADPAAPVPGVGADRPRALGPRAHRGALALDLPRRRRAARPARRRCWPARSRAGTCCARSASRCTRPSTASTPSAGRSNAPSRSSAPRTPPSASSAADRRLLEEPRMEAHGCRDFPPDSIRGRFVAARAAGRGRRHAAAALRRRAARARRSPAGR